MVNKVGNTGIFTRTPEETATEHAEGDARCGRAWSCACAACRMARSAGFVSPVKTCGKLAPEGYPGAGAPCSRPVGHDGAHEARDSKGRVVARSTEPTKVTTLSKQGGSDWGLSK